MRSKRARRAGLHWLAAAICVALVLACDRTQEPADAPEASPDMPGELQGTPEAPSPSREGGSTQGVSPSAKLPIVPPAPGTAPTMERLRTIERIPFEEEDPQRAVTALDSYLSDPELDVREAAVMALAEVEGEAADRALAQHVRTEKDSMLKIDMVDELIDREAPQSLDTLLYLLADTDAEVRERAADGLDELGDERAVPSLHDALRAEQDEFVRDAILFALSSLDEDFDEEQYDFEE